MSVIKINKSTNFSIISNDVINDNRLSWKARGILVYLLSKPNDWTVKRNDLINNSEEDGERSVKSALKELVNLGYAKLKKGEYRDKDGKNKFGSFYDIYEQPVSP